MKTLFQSVLLLLLLIAGGDAMGQGSLPLLIDLSPVEGRELTTQSALDYRIVHNGTTPIEVRIKGTIRHRDQKMYLKYEFTRRLQPGMNLIADSRSGINWQSDNSGLRSLFVDYGRLPQGTYEYCVEVLPGGSTVEQPAIEGNVECVYHTADDLFALNLIDPEDKAVLRAPYPVFSWVANCPFVAELTYRIRVAEQHPGQNAVNAIARNNPMWQESGLFAPTAVYPVNGRPLEYGVPYVWTVDAYYRGLLIGGAETWRFMLLEDSLLPAVPRATYHIDIRQEKGENAVFAIGELKIKYHLRELRSDSLQFTLLTTDGKDLKLPRAAYAISEGDNRIEIDLREVSGIRHMKKYVMKVQDGSGNTYQLPIRYINPEFL